MTFSSQLPARLHFLQALCIDLFKPSLLLSILGFYFLIVCTSLYLFN